MSNNNVIYFTSLLVTFILLFTLSDKPAITGFATFASGSEVRNVVSQISSLDEFSLLKEGTQLCAVIEISNETAYYYKITKTGEIVSYEEKYCADPNQDNIIVKFNSYDSLLQFQANPADFVKTKKNTGYYVFPSNYVQQGGDVACSATFQKNYCPALYYDLKKSDMANLGLVCCANYELTADENAAIASLKKTKGGTLESPFTFLFSTTGIIVVIGAILFIVVISALIMVKPKNPLVDYVASVRTQGYSDEDIKKALINSGWEQKTIDDALKIKK